jgi:hypothetical protein
MGTPKSWLPTTGTARYHRIALRAMFAALTMASATAMSGCFAAPEACHGCRSAMGDGGEAGSGTGSGGELGAGGAGTGGTGPAGTGGAGGVGVPGTGGALGGTGGASAAGGAGSGGTTGAGGAGTGGSGLGGAGTGGAGTGGAGTGGAGTGGMPPPLDPDLVLWYQLDESSGTIAADSAMSGGVARPATLTSVGTGAATFSTTAKVGSHSLRMSGTSATNGGYATIPSLQTLAPGALTIACWVYITADQMWQRVFDLGVTSTATPVVPLRYMFLTTHQAIGTASVRFAITTMGNTMEDRINMTTPALLTLNAWHHLAVTLTAGAPSTGTLYIDHAVAGSNAAMTLHAADLGATDANFIGKSQFAADAYFAGMVDDFRVYKRALTTAEIAALP